MKLKHIQTKGNRLKNQYLCISTIDKDDTNYWYFNDLNKWIDTFAFDNCNNIPKSEMSNFQNCKSIRAFRRKLKKCPKGVEFILESKYYKVNVIGKGTGDL